MIGKVSKDSIELAKAFDIDLSSGSLNKTHGRVIIFVKEKYPGTHKSGYALRSRVVWWLHTGEVVKGLDGNIHHRNEDRIDDRFVNLEHLSHGDHTKYHHTKLNFVDRLCLNCGDTFQIREWRLRDPSRGKFCSQSCYQEFPKSDESKEKRSETLKKMYKDGWRA